MRPRRRKFEVERENHERWLISYADFITLLFAFFVVMYAISSVNHGKYKVLTTSLVSAFGSEKDAQEAIDQLKSNSLGLKTKPKGDTFIKPYQEVPKKFTPSPEQQQVMEKMAMQLNQAMRSLVKTSQVKVIQTNQGLRIDIDSSLLFLPGSAEIEPSGVAPLVEVSTVLRKQDHLVQVEGHTDNQPIHNEKFYSNWELSALRASSVVRMFASLGIPEKRLSAVGFGEVRPVAENFSDLGRAKNRRVSVMVLFEQPQDEVPVSE